MFEDVPACDISPRTYGMPLLVFEHQVGSVHVSLAQSYNKTDPKVAAALSDEVEYTYTIKNNGMLSLYDIDIADEELSAREVTMSCTDVDSLKVSGTDFGEVTGLAAYPGNGLAPAASLKCTAKDAVSQTEVREGKIKP